jgi:hypothetical protein
MCYVGNYGLAYVLLDCTAELKGNLSYWMSLSVGELKEVKRVWWREAWNI